jgi:hypothetical protein
LNNGKKRLSEAKNRLRLSEAKNRLRLSKAKNSWIWVIISKKGRQSK